MLSFLVFDVLPVVAKTTISKNINSEIIGNAPTGTADIALRILPENIIVKPQNINTTQTVNSEILLDTNLQSASGEKNQESN